jgi:dethiobiotin synthetase/adenosylmethionine--8-amino-7-oxononanoate aminotransferase
MDVAEPSIFNEGQHPWYEPKGLFLSSPALGFQDGTLKITFPEDLPPHDDGAKYEFDSVEKAMDVRARMLTSLFSQYKETIEMEWLVYEHSGVNRKIASVVLEPVLMGAGGMKFVDPLWQRALMDVAKSRNTPVIFDEVASGLFRVGVKSCRELLQSDPDIACYAKLLTGGLLPLSVTLASEEVFETYLGDEKGQALLHGHSYTAHPVGCVSALQALDAYDAVFKTQQKGKPFMLFDTEMTRELSRLPIVENSFSLGTVLAVSLKPEEDGASGYAASSRTVPIVKKLREKGIYARPLGNVLYIMASPLTSKEDCSRIARILYETIEEEQ